MTPLSPKPLVSVVMPTRNAVRYVAAAVRSVLDQTRDTSADAGHAFALDVIVVDDGSTDGSADAVRAIGDCRVRVIDGPCDGIAAAYNAGLEVARGEYLARCDADDLYPPGRLRRQLAFVRERPEFIAICGGYTTTLADGRRVVDHLHPPAGDMTDELLNGRGRSHWCAYLTRTEAVRTIGGCRTWFVTSEDADIQFRLAAVGRVSYEPVSTYLYRLHDASITHGARARRTFFHDAAVRFAAQRKVIGSDDLQRGTPPVPPASHGGGAPATRETASAHAARLLTSEAWRRLADRDGRAAVASAWRAWRLTPVSGGSAASFGKVAAKAFCAGLFGSRSPVPSTLSVERS